MASRKRRFRTGAAIGMRTNLPCLAAEEEPFIS
jgi:hypothetical protein